jgi:transcriptional regulator of acetoin/glycerol metabolism
MVLLNEHDRTFLGAVTKLAYCNPFLPERIEYERQALGRDFSDAEPVWSMRVDDPDRPNVNAVKVTDRVEKLCRQLRELLSSGVFVTDPELELYKDGVLFLLYHRYEERLLAAAMAELGANAGQARFDFYTEFVRDWQSYFHVPVIAGQSSHDAAHLFALFFQIRRAFHLIFRNIVGSSMVAAQLRAAAWQSIFTHDMQRYRDTLYERMGDITTLITGPSGTGKELVARAIGMSRYIPLDAKKKAFAGNFSSAFHALNLSAMPSTLIESELFGHRRGAFTGAIQDRRGWLEVCEPWGSIFLDEVGDLDSTVQVKLLRVLQTRTFQPLGDTKDKLFRGKIIAATNRDLADAMQKSNFRTDFYYRLCADIIVTPSLQEQLRESPQVLREMITFIARSFAGSDAEALVDEVEGWIKKHLPRNYSWPGNIRELEQCVRSVLVRKEYRPPRVRASSALEELIKSIHDGALTAEEVLCRYCTLVYSQTGSYEETARRLRLDRRTVKSKIDVNLLARLRASG